MQFVILLIGVLVFVFYLFTPPPLFFNTPALERVARSEHRAELDALEGRWQAAFEQRRDAALAFVAAGDDGAAGDGARTALRAAGARLDRLRAEARTLIGKALPGSDVKDADYVFIDFVLRYVPSGLVGLLIAVILCAAMSSTSGELAALGSTTTVDFYKRLFGGGGTPRGDLLASKLFTVLWGLVAVGFATFAALIDNLIQAVNILGSIFYGTVLGLFVVAFFLRWVTATPVLVAGLVAQAVVIALFFASDVGFLWYNVVGCGVVVLFSALMQPALGGWDAIPAGRE